MFADAGRMLTDDFIGYLSDYNIHAEQLDTHSLDTGVCTLKKFCLVVARKGAPPPVPEADLAANDPTTVATATDIAASAETTTTVASAEPYATEPERMSDASARRLTEGLCSAVRYLRRYRTKSGEVKYSYRL